MVVAGPKIRLPCWKGVISVCVCLLKVLQYSIFIDNPKFSLLIRWYHDLCKHYHGGFNSNFYVGLWTFWMPVFPRKHGHPRMDVWKILFQFHKHCFFVSMWKSLHVFPVIQTPPMWGSLLHVFPVCYWWTFSVFPMGFRSKRVWWDFSSRTSNAGDAANAKRSSRRRLSVQGHCIANSNNAMFEGKIPWSYHTQTKFFIFLRGNPSSVIICIFCIAWFPKNGQI